MLSICLENDDDGDNDRQYNDSRTYSDHPVPTPGCEQFAVWAERYAVNVFALSFIDQVTATMTVSEPGVPSTKKGPNQILAPVFAS